MRKRTNPAQASLLPEEPFMHKQSGSKKGHFVKPPATIHLEALRPNSGHVDGRTLPHCFDTGKGSLSWDSAINTEKTFNPDLVTCRHCLSAIVGTSAYGALKRRVP